MIETEVTRLKSKIATILTQSKNLIEVLDLKKDKNGNIVEELMYNRIYPYLWMPVEEGADSFLCFDIATPDINNNDYFRDAELIFYIVVHKEHAQTQWGAVRHDLLAGILIEELFNWRGDIGQEIKLIDDMPKIWSTKFFGRVLGFGQLQLNSILCGGIKDRRPRTVQNFVR